MARIPKKIICIATVAVIICAHVPVVHAEALPNVLEGSSTLADNIMTYYALSGSAVANKDWINTLYNSYGSSFGTIYDLAENGMLTLNNDGTWQATTTLETAIENAPAYQSLGLDQVFNVSAQEAAAGGGIAASGAATLAGSLGGVASTGVLPLFGGVTVSYWAGIGLGTLIAHKLGLYSKPVYYGLDMQFDEGFINSIPSGGSVYSYKKVGQNSGYNFRIADPGLIGFCYYDGSSSSPDEGEMYTWNFYNPTDSKKKFYSYNFKNHSISYTYTVQPYSKYGSSTESYLGYTDGFTVLDSDKSNSQLKDLYNSGELKVKSRHSPDLIGDKGNLTGSSDENGNITVPDMKPQIDPGVQSGKPLTLQDWLNFANSVTNNNSNTNPLPDNKTLFDDLLNAIKKAIPNPNPNPNPDPDPDPDPDPYHPPKPTPVPDPDYGDPNPDQPDFESETDIPDPVGTGNPWITPDLLDKFPFCIPKDMIDMVKGFKSADRVAPHISWNFKSPVGHVDYTFNLDLEDFEDVATLLRALELAAFIVGLAFATRYLIGAS